MVHSYNGVGCLQQGGCKVIDNDIISVASVRMQTHGEGGGTNFCVDGDRTEVILMMKIMVAVEMA